MKLTVDIKKDYGSFKLSSSFETEDLLTGFLGSSGSGKSMTLKCIAGIVTPDEGYIALDDRVLFDSSKRINIRPKERKVGYLFQNYALFPAMTVKKNICCGLVREKDREAKKRKYDKAMSLLHLEGLENRLPSQLSGGQAQRVALARIIVSEPDLLLLDEPFSALDAFLRRNLQTELLEVLQNLGKQAVLVTHSAREVRRMTTNLFVMKSGEIIRRGRTEDVFSDPQSDDCRVLLEDY